MKSMKKPVLHPEQSVLVVIDIQEKFMPILFESERLLAKTEILLKISNALDIPILITEQYPTGLGSTVSSIQGLMVQNKNYKVLEKTTFSSYEAPHFKDALTALARDQVIICGIEAHVCVNQTVQDLLMSDYQVHLIQDAITSRTETNYKLGLQKMLYAGAVPSGTEMALFELLHDAKHPQFKALQALIK
jgi:nicotinamidase-related amidase